MIVDSSAVLAIVFDEPTKQRLQRALASADDIAMSAVNWFEAAMVTEGQGDADTRARFDRMIEEEDITLVAFTPAQALLAREAWRRYGKGRHKAALNFGDCMAYALAKERGEPLLFVGNDFAQTDIESALTG